MDKVMQEIMKEFRTLPYDIKLDVLNFVREMKKRPSSGNSNGQQQHR